jgi:hypothetical protein
VDVRWFDTSHHPLPTRAPHDDVAHDDVAHLSFMPRTVTTVLTDIDTAHHSALTTSIASQTPHSSSHSSPMPPSIRYEGPALDYYTSNITSWAIDDHWAPEIHPSPANDGTYLLYHTALTKVCGAC